MKRLSALLLLGAFLYARAHAGPIAGTAIDNVAQASGDLANGTGTLTLSSNLVRTVVAASTGATLVRDQSAIVPAGSPASFAHRLTNTGNSATTFRLDLANLAGDAWDLAALTLTHDLDRDGLSGPLDVPLVPGLGLTLAAGDSADLILGGTVPAAAANGTLARVEIRATAQGSGETVANTDTISASPALVAPGLAFFESSAYATTIRLSPLNSPLWVEADAPQCDADAARRDTVTLTLTSSRTGDFESFRAIETGANTGRFRIEPNVPTFDATLGLAATRTGVVEVATNDVVHARLAGCGAIVTDAEVWIAPAGVVFDARTGQSVAGARVSLVDVTGAGNGGNAGGPARVFLADGVTPAPSSLVTDPSGGYAFELVPSSTYRIDVAPPATHRFPSGVPAASLPGARVIDPAGSYGAAFYVVPSLAPVTWDLPLDAKPVVSLYAEKTASRVSVEVGDELVYAVRIESRSDSALAAVSVADRLPYGFQYVPGSARRDSLAIADPAGGRGPDLDFALGAFAPRESATLRYRARVGPGALDGDGINRAWAQSDSVRSNVAIARVAITGGVFADEATLLGTVWLDLDGDRRRDSGEPGMPGVRLYLDDGTWAVTDRNGAYSLYGLEPRASALKLDRTTLPSSVKPVARDRRDAHTPGLRLLDLRLGELQRADFLLAPDSMRFGADTAAVAAARARRESPGAFGNEIVRGLAQGGAFAETGRVPGDPRARPTSAVTTGESRLPLFDDTRARVAASNASAALRPALSLEQLAPTLDPDLGFIGLDDLDTVLVNQIAVRVKGRPGVVLRLRVNGEEIPETRVGRRVTAHLAGVEAWEYLGVSLREGINVLEVAPPQSLGRIAVRIVAPGPIAHVEITPRRRSIADGSTPAPVAVRVTDSRGIPVAARTLVTLESTLGTFATRDLDPATPGLQLAVEGGESVVGIVPPATPGRALLSARAGSLRSSAVMDFGPELRPMLAFGSFEGTVSFGSFRRGRNAAQHPQTGFESWASQFRSERKDGRASAVARGAVFMKGRVFDDVLLTLGYATDKPGDLRRFRDIQPDAFYPVYGDASVRGYEAQSTGRLFVRADRGPASVLFGDFITRGSGGTRSLSAYSRSLTGAQHHFEDGRVRVDAFTSRERTRRRIEELPGQGVSGPYRIPGAPIVENSERVEIVTRDRNQPSVILVSTPRTRFTDYDIDPIEGRLLFKQPVPSLDPNLNPVFVRVGYEVESGGEPFWVSGAETRVRLGTTLEAGGSYVDDHDPQKPWELRSVTLAAKLAAKTVLEAEWAVTRRIGGERGDASRFELRHENGSVQAFAFGSATGAEFDNPGAGFGPGRTEAGARLQARLDERTGVRAEALFSADAFNREQRGGVLLGLDRTLARGVQGELGLRVAGEERRTGFEEPTSYAVRARLQAQAQRRPDLSAFVEFEQSVLDSRRLAAIGGEYRLRSRGRLYARHELISSLGGPWSLTAQQRRLSTVAGVDAEVRTNTHAFGEYRLGNVVSGREGEAALGLRNTWVVDEAMRIGTTFERVSPLRGSSAGPSTALTGSIEYAEGERWKGSSRFEVRTSRASDGFLMSMAAAVRLDSAWTALGRHLLSYEDARANGSNGRMRFSIGAAYRDPSREIWDALSRYEFRYDREVPRSGFQHRRIAHVVSLHGTGSVGRPFEASLGWAGKLVTERADGTANRSGAHRAFARGTYSFARDWDASLAASGLFGRGFGQRRDGLGAEIGRQLGSGVWLAAGWNRFGYEDDELAGEEYTREGCFLRLRARFDEEMFRRAREVRR